MYTDKKHKNKSTTTPVQQKKSQGIVLTDNRPETVVQQQKNNTGLPDNLKSGMESISGHSLNDVKVHYNSSKPAQLSAHAYAQGIQIHLGPGQEKHLPHEAWHVVQQKQGRVKPTTEVNGAQVNDNIGLEKEADVMGAKALQRKSKESVNSVIQVKCLECNASKGHSPKCSKYKPSAEAKTYTDEELMAKAVAKQASMAKTHHDKTGAPGTPASRQENWKKESEKDLFDRMKKSQEKKK